MYTGQIISPIWPWTVEIEPEVGRAVDWSSLHPPQWYFQKKGLCWAQLIKVSFPEFNLGSIFQSKEKKVQ